MASLPSPADAAVAALAASPVLGVLSLDSLQSLAGRGAAVNLDAGGLLFQTGAPGDAAFAILTGELEVRTTSLDGHDLRFSALGPGALVGEMAALDGGVRSADVYAARRTRLWRIPRQALMDALTSEPAAALAVIAELSRRLRAANTTFEQVQRLDLAGRLAVLILAERNGQDTVILTQAEIARRLACSREEVNRRLHIWIRQGWVRLGPGGTQLLDAAALQQIARPV